MAIHYVNTGTALGTLPMVKRDVNTEFAKPPTGTFEYLLFNLRGMERVFDGMTTIAAERYPKVVVMVPDQYVTNEFLQESAEKRRGIESSPINAILLSKFPPANPTNNLELNSKSKKEAGLGNYRAYHQLYQQTFQLYNRISSNARLHANQVYNATVEAFKKLRQGVYKKDMEVGVQEEYRPNLRAKFRDNAERVLKYLRTHGSNYLRAIKRQHLPVQDLSVKGLEALLQEV